MTKTTIVIAVAFLLSIINYQLSIINYQDDINVNLGITNVSSDSQSNQTEEFLAEDSENAALGLHYFLRNNAALILEKGLADNEDFFAFGFEYQFANKPYGLMLSRLQGNQSETINLSLVYHFQANQDLRDTQRNGQRWHSSILEK